MDTKSKISPRYEMYATFEFPEYAVYVRFSVFAGQYVELFLAGNFLSLFKENLTYLHSHCENKIRSKKKSWII